MRARMIPWVASSLLAACAPAAPPDSLDASSIEAGADSNTSADASVNTDSSVNADADTRVPFATRVVSFTPGPPGETFGSNRLPGVVLGPPQGGGEYFGSTDVVSLGAGGTICLELGEDVVDGPGADLLVFENAFRVRNTTTIWRELGEVSVSADGVTYATFACDPTSSDLRGCAGWNPVLSASDNAIDPTDPAVAGGDPFDLASLGMTRARFVCVRDLGTQSDSGANTGFDLDAVSVVHTAR